MAKALVPIGAFREKFGDVRAEDIVPRLHELVAQFLHDSPIVDRRREPVRS
jgi:hypothetical protein